jgi:hypothetical protein
VRDCVLPCTFIVAHEVVESNRILAIAARPASDVQPRRHARRLASRKPVDSVRLRRDTWVRVLPARAALERFWQAQRMRQAGACVMAACLRWHNKLALAWSEALPALQAPAHRTRRKARWF